MSVTSGTKSESDFCGRLCCPPMCHCAAYPNFPVPALQHSLRIDEGHAPGRRRSVRFKYSDGYSHYSIPLSPPLFSGRIFGSEPYSAATSWCSGCRRTIHRLHQARDRAAGRPHPDEGGAALHQRQARGARALERFHRPGLLAGRMPPRGSSAGRRRCRTASPMSLSIPFENGFYDNTVIDTVPPYYFMMGYNRDNFIRQPRVVGGGLCAVLENFDRPRPDRSRSIAEGDRRPHASWRWPTAVRWNRIFKIAVMNDEDHAFGPRRRRAKQALSPTLVASLRRRRKRGKAGAKAAAASSRRASGNQFADPALLATAFTHVSALKSARKRGDSYQRLEFLGDHVLGLIVSDMLYRAFPNADEGELSKRLADLVRKESCADVAKSLGLLDDIKLGAVGAGAGARLRKSVLGYICEGGDRRGVSRRRLRCSSPIRRTQLDRTDAQAAAAAARSQDRVAGKRRRKARACRRRSIAKSSAPGRITIRSPGLRWICPDWIRPKVSAAASAPPKRSQPRCDCQREGVGGGNNDG